MLQQPLASKVCGSNIGVETELFTEFEKTLLRTDWTYSPFGSTDGTCDVVTVIVMSMTWLYMSFGEELVGNLLTKQNRIRFLACLQRRVWQRYSMVINTGTTEIMRLEVEAEVGFGGDGLEDADGLGGHFWACARLRGWVSEVCGDGEGGERLTDTITRKDDDVEAVSKVGNQSPKQHPFSLLLH